MVMPHRQHCLEYVQDIRKGREASDMDHTHHIQSNINAHSDDSPSIWATWIGLLATQLPDRKLPSAFGQSPWESGAEVIARTFHSLQ